MPPSPPHSRRVILGAPTIIAEAGPNPRKVRRNIHSCVECKRRKVRCQLGTGNAAVCVGCLNRGIACVVQQAGREDDFPGAARFDEKLDRIESLLKRLVENDTSFASGATQSASTVNRSIASDSHATSIASSSNHEGDRPNRDFSDNVILKNHGEIAQLHEQGNPSQDFRRLKKLEEIRDSLSALLPSQHDADLIAGATNSWGLAKVFCTPANDLYKNDDPLSSFNLVAVSKRHPIIVARTLLYIAICIQQLPPEFEMSRLQIVSSLDVEMDKYISVVAGLVTSDDELVTTIEGLECLLLQGLFHLNAGNLRRAWLSVRKALSIAQLMCLDKCFMKARKGLDSSSTKAGQQMWQQIVMTDRYVSLLLGLPCGTGDDCFGPEEKLDGSDDDVDLIFERRLTLIAGCISKRNQAEPSHIFPQTQVIDEDMDRLAKEMPQHWWDIPQFDAKNRSRGVAQQLARLTTQMWYYQLETLLHLPFMLRAATGHRYLYNRQTCLTASREILLRYIALRNVNNTQLICRVVDFAAFISGVVIALASIHTSQQGEGARPQQHNDDMALLQEIIASMEILAKSSEREIVAKQSVEALKALINVNAPSGASSGNLHLTIPYFGTINISRPNIIRNASPINSVRPIQNIHASNITAIVQGGPEIPSQFVNAADLHGIPISPNPPSTPVVSFISSQFPSLGPELSMENWEWQDEDTLFFDSLLTSDIGGFDLI